MAVLTSHLIETVKNLCALSCALPLPANLMSRVKTNVTNMLRKDIEVTIYRLHNVEKDLFFFNFARPFLCSKVFWQLTFLTCMC